MRDKIKNSLKGEFHTSSLYRRMYATDASVYRRLPMAVAVPRDASDIRKLVRFAGENGLSLIPRSAGTSLAGQVVGEGIVVDVSKYMNRVQEINVAERWVRVQPGVIRDELNLVLKPFGLHFGPNTATSNRCMIGGMTGNNSCGSTSIVYGTTRDKILELTTVLSDGTEAVFKSLSRAEFEQKQKGDELENGLYRHLGEMLGKEEVRKMVAEAFPPPELHRRNTGYALDIMARSGWFEEEGEPGNMAKLLCGSEGTLAFSTEMVLRLDPLPPPAERLLAVHFDSLGDSLRAAARVLREGVYACELMDDIILGCTEGLPKYRKKREFVQGKPKAILMVECRGDNEGAAEGIARSVAEDLKRDRLGTAWPVLKPPESEGAWDLRKAGLGLLSNIPGDKRPVACVEDTAVPVEILPEYIAEFDRMMEEFGQKAVHYAHAGAGELHLRPILNLKTEEGRRQFREIGRASAELVKKYKGSLSGEHGDGVVRSGFIPLVLGDEMVALFEKLKRAWDPHAVFNPQKITDPWPMDLHLRFEGQDGYREERSILRLGEGESLLQMAERCNGSGDCRKKTWAGGTMCPTYMATLDEKDTTRARANVLREVLVQNGNGYGLEDPDLKEVLDLCISCKGCRAECPSGVDMAAMKAEYQHRYYQNRERNRRDRLFANTFRYDRLSAMAPAIAGLATRGAGAWLAKKLTGIHPKRNLPRVRSKGLYKWWKKLPVTRHSSTPKGEVLFFIDEFTAWQDAEIGMRAIALLESLGYKVRCQAPMQSGRSWISKGFLDEAKRIAQENVEKLKYVVDPKRPLIGLEPSAILSFRDEIPRLVPEGQRKDAQMIGDCSFMIDEFLAAEAQAGRIGEADFDELERRILFHGHCHQKALSEDAHSAFILGMPKGHEVERIPSGCCGMAGSFGYEKEHYELSMKIGELVLFPAIREKGDNWRIAATGTSCRHQIKDGCGRMAQHPVEILYEALRHPVISIP